MIPSSGTKDNMIKLTKSQWYMFGFKVIPGSHPDTDEKYFEDQVEVMFGFFDIN